MVNIRTSVSSPISMWKLWVFNCNLNVTELESRGFLELAGQSPNGQHPVSQNPLRKLVSKDKVDGSQGIAQEADLSS